MKTGSSIVFVLASVFASNVGAFAPIARTAHPTFRLNMAVDDMTEVREYFNSEGFNRWNKIYSESDDVNSVQMDIREGHDQTIQKILNWVQADGDIAGKTVCDCGCGVGSLAIPLAQMGAFNTVLLAAHRYVHTSSKGRSRYAHSLLSPIFFCRCQSFCK